MRAGSGGGEEEPLKKKEEEQQDDQETKTRAALALAVGSQQLALERRRYIVQ